MFGSIGFPEVVLIFIVVLLLFGPQKLPEFAKLLGKAIREFRKTINDAKATIEDEIEKADIADDLKDLKGIDREIKDMTNVDRLIEGTDIAGDLKEMKDLNREIKDMTNLNIDEDVKNTTGPDDDKKNESE